MKEQDEFAENFVKLRESDKRMLASTIQSFLSAYAAIRTEQLEEGERYENENQKQRNV